MMPELAWKPKKHIPGMGGVAGGPQSTGRENPRLRDQILEMCNLSNGERTIAQIARIIRYELGPIEDTAVIQVLKALEAQGFLTFLKEESK